MAFFIDSNGSYRSYSNNSDPFTANYFMYRFQAEGLKEPVILPKEERAYLKFYPTR
jgi:hypothetical protein